MSKINSPLDEEEMTSIIYDTIMKNKNHPQFDTDLSENEETGDNVIHFRYLGSDFKIIIEKV